MSTSPIAEWLEGHARKRGVAGLKTGGGINYHFEFVAYFLWITGRRRPYKWNQTWRSSRVMVDRNRFNIKTNMAAVYMTTCQL